MEPFKKENRPGCAFTARIADEAFGMCRKVLDRSNKKIDDGLDLCDSGILWHTLATLKTSGRQ
jgi:hypothetical protein